jgi:hypothetical protein
MKLIRKICIKLSPKNVLDENVTLTAVFVILVPPLRIAPYQWLSGGALTELPLTKIVHQAKKLRPVISRRIFLHRHLEP